EPAAKKIEAIANDRRQYHARKDIPLADHLLKLSPSSAMVSEVRRKVEEAETRLLKERPYSLETLDLCTDSFDLGASVFYNIGSLAGDSQTPEAAEQINNQLKDVQQLKMFNNCEATSCLPASVSRQLSSSKNMASMSAVRNVSKEPTGIMKVSISTLLQSTLLS
ncbi:MAG: hypothetical protein ACYS8I_07105, partial [Planctomycetota bacterium]